MPKAGQSESCAITDGMRTQGTECWGMYAVLRTLYADGSPGDRHA
jgi:hypothetical protein